MPSSTIATPHPQAAWRKWLHHAVPTCAFFGGFIWDALTLGRSVQWLDLTLLLGYLLLAGGILWWLGHSRHKKSLNPITDNPQDTPVQNSKLRHLDGLPFLLLQFLFGGLFSALFIFYFKSASHILAFFTAAGLGLLLVLNEFIHSHYQRFTLTWALFGLCAMLLFNFLLPYAIGSIHAAWFYLSTLAGAALAQFLRKKTPGKPGYIFPVWMIAALLCSAYWLDAIPPVPLVKKDLQVGIAFSKNANLYQLQVESPHWWKFWQSPLHIGPNEAVYCVSVVFAPRGLHTELYHRWQIYDKKQGWRTSSRIGFALAGGRNGGFRGYTYKQSLSAGLWRVSVETETGRTLSSREFEVFISPDATATNNSMLQLHSF